MNNLNVVQPSVQAEGMDEFTFYDIIHKNVNERDSSNEFNNKINVNSHKLLLKFNMN